MCEVLLEPTGFVGDVQSHAFASSLCWIVHSAMRPYTTSSGGHICQKQYPRITHLQSLMAVACGPQSDRLSALCRPGSICW